MDKDWLVPAAPSTVQGQLEIANIPLVKKKSKKPYLVTIVTPEPPVHKISDSDIPAIILLRTLFYFARKQN